MTRAVLGIDVGTGSARAGLFDLTGALLGTAARDIRLHEAPGGIAEHESADIWDAVCAAVRGALAQAGPVEVIGIGTDAACSLVVEGQQLSEGGSPARDVIVWMDHRATDEAEEINATGHEVLRYVGGRISPEMQTPKLLWLARHRPEAFAAAPRFMDLADWLTFRMTGSEARSTCTVTCKWTYLAHGPGWRPDYFEAVGLGALADEGFARIGTEIRAPGTPLGGLTAEAASALDLPEGTPVAAGLIDAHAGGVGTLGGDGAPGDATTRLAYVYGTSACTMASHPDPVFVPGVWGPYFDAMIPGLWLNEGGQSAAGAALDQLVRLHPAYPGLGPDPLGALTARAGAMDDVQRRAGRYTVVPDFNGNRAPLADPAARAVVAGLGMERDTDSLALLFVAGLTGIAHGLRQILDAQAAHGLACDAIVISGGAGANPLARRILADVTGRPVAVPESPEPVLLGAAMLGAVAGGAGALAEVMPRLSRFETVLEPDTGLGELHDRGHARFLALQRAAGVDPSHSSKI